MESIDSIENKISENPTGAKDNRLRNALFILSGWIIIALIISSSAMLVYSLKPGENDFSIITVFIQEIASLSPWIILTPIIVKISRRFPFEKVGVVRFTIVHTGMALIVFSIHAIVQAYWVSVFYGEPLTWSYLGRDFLGFLDMRVMLYLGLLLIVYGIDFQQMEQEVKLEQIRLKSRLDQAEFQTLLNQFQPSFFMNCIDSIKEKLESNVKQAEDILTDFSDLLRIMLRDQEDEEVSIKEDIETYILYINLLESRTDASIKKEVEVNEECLDALIPPFSLFIPVLENAVQLVQQRGLYFSGFKYQADCASDRLQACLTAELPGLPSVYLRNSFPDLGIMDVQNHLQRKYGDAVNISSNTEDQQINWKLTLPLKFLYKSPGVE